MGANVDREIMPIIRGESNRRKGDNETRQRIGPMSLIISSGAGFLDAKIAQPIIDFIGRVRRLIGRGAGGFIERLPEHSGPNDARATGADP